MNYTDEENTYEKKINSKTRLKTADFKKIKLYCHIDNAIFNEDWDLAERYMGKIKNSAVLKQIKSKSGSFKRNYKVRVGRIRYDSLPGINASEQTRLIGELEYLVENKISKKDINFRLEEGNARYNL